ncbi:hypothetical protein [Kinneretia aquatilis]|jgi:hypothetical protein|uniref:hypothetical protein n=1 Tax=Kinneretia aquatilis TaxID=2070761 RepID=UPI00149515F5|nr:hypothetical protein [Paucibacter aquatile]WIV99510.1 hypothetical protein K9V56_008520 [Paucibacter aquatile]
MLFQRELQELQQRQLALRLRNIELRAELGGSVRELMQPLQMARSFMAGSSELGNAGARGWWSSGLVALAALGLGWAARRRMHAGSAAQAANGPVESVLGWLRLGLRVARLWREFSRAGAGGDGRRPSAASAASDTGL